MLETQRIILCTAFALAAMTCPVATATEQAALGAPDFYPSPERPVGFRGDGNGCFPGATPVTTFAEGALDQEKVSWKDRKGRDKEHTVWTIAAGSSPTNVVWKTAMPGWTTSMPVVAGDKVFTMAEPHTLVCVDAHSGEILWQRANNPFLLLGKSSAEAEQLQELASMARASWLLSRLVTPGRWGSANFKDTTSEKGKAQIGAAIKDLEGIRQAVAQIDASLAGEIDAMITGLRGWMTTQPDNSPNQIGGFAKAVSDRFALPMNNQWTSMVGFTMPTPVTDGRHVFATIGQGQAVCYDYDGNLVWGRIFPGITHLRVHHVVSPLLIGDVLVAALHDKLRGLDKATGKTLWEVGISVGGGYNAGSHKHLRLGSVDVIATTSGKILRASDGKVLADLPYSHGKEGGGPSVIGADGILVFEKYRAPGSKAKRGSGYWRGRLQLEGDTVTLTDVQVLAGEEKAKGGPPATPILCGGLLVSHERVWRVDTGAALCQPPRRGGPSEKWCSGIMVAGQRAIFPAASETSGYARSRPDGLVTMEFRIYDFSDPTTWNVVSTGNVLGGENKPVFPALERYAPSVVTQDRYANYGLPPQFGCYNAGGMFAQGNRLFIRSTSHLYCIGDPKQKYDWDPASR